MDINDWVFLIAITDVYIDTMTKAENFDLVRQAKQLKEKIINGDICKEKE